MDKYTSEELESTLKVVSSVINRCEKAQLKFEEGTSQYSLLKNRLKAMYISKSLITNDMEGHTLQKEAEYTKEELEKAIKPVASVISKCEKAQVKFTEGTTHHTRFQNIINAMNISKSLITDELSKRE